MKHYIYLVAVFFLLVSCGTAPVSTSGRVTVNDKNTTVDVVFSDHDRRLIHDYYHQQYKGKHKGLPPGLAKRQQLPPGLEKQLRRNGRLPPGIEKQALPYDLERRLSPLPHDIVRARIGFEIVLMNKNTQVILDIIHDIGR